MLKDAARSGRPPSPQVPQDGRPQSQRPPEERERGEGARGLSPRKSKVIGSCCETEIRGAAEIRAERQEAIRSSKQTLQPSALQLCRSSCFLCTTSARQKEILRTPKKSRLQRSSFSPVFDRGRRHLYQALLQNRARHPAPMALSSNGKCWPGLPDFEAFV